MNMEMLTSHVSITLIVLCRLSIWFYFLQHAKVHEAVWLHFGLDLTYPMPVFEEQLMYEAISFILHNSAVVKCLTKHHRI